MHASWQRSAVARAARSAVASSFLTAGLATLLVGGCGRSDSADRTLSQKVAAVQPSTGNVEDRKLVVQELQKAMQVQGASDGAKLNASMRLADAEIAVGDALARESADLEIKAARLGGEIRALTAQIRANNVAVAGYRGMDPKSAQQAIDEQKDAVAKGKENGLWISDGASPIPAQQTLTTEIDRLNKEIADLQQKRATLENEQKEATAQADKLTEEGIKTKGQQALDLGIQAAELRKKSRDAGAQMEALDLQISHDQHDLKIAQSRQAVAAEALKALDAHKGELDATWSQVSDRMKAEAAMSQKLLGEEGAGSRGSTGGSATPAAAPSADATAAGGGAAGANGAAPATQSVSAADMEALAKQNTIAPKLEDIARQVAEAADRRREALDSYGAARRHTNEAAQAAAKLDSELAKLVNDQKNRTNSERPAWEQAREALTANRFTFRQALIDVKEAAVHATAAAGLRWRADLKNEIQTVLQSATLNPPAVIDAKGFGTTQEADAEREAALTGYKDAEDKLASIDNEQGTPTKQDISRAARAILATTQYERSQFLARIGDTAGADQARKTAIDTIKQIKEENWPLPAVMAPELAEAAGIMPIAPTTRPGAGPTTGPTTEPTTAPTTGEAEQATPATAPTTAPSAEPNPTAPPTATPDTTTPPPAVPTPTAPPPAATPTTPPPAAPTTPPPAAPTTPPPAAPTTPPPAAPTTPPPAAPTTPPPAAPVNK
jgi:hypothetical protein